jgi:hypothetical protein
MEQENQNTQNQQAAQQPPQFVCTGDCKKCLSVQQWSFCASVHAFSNMKVLDKVMEALVGMQAQMQAMQGEIQGLSEKIEAMQNSEPRVFDPNGELFPKEKNDIKKDSAERAAAQKVGSQDN